MRMKILIADDEKDIRFLISQYLKEINGNLEIAGVVSNGEEAVEFCRKYKVDMVISDIRMPYMTGLEMLKKLRETNENILCVFISAYTDFSYVQEAIRNGAGGYLLKPIQKKNWRILWSKCILSGRKKRKKRAA